ncbi:hypothetical protein PsorP6_009886 [Peronosclerospora sorghi]|uniref:Uncharacterized protein n=1 Tax=Peronosclerospora sorghi TaxID=230839 RepID=A0ACC0VY75_9STRA|nr:hypothetical protein PsorP6_009886 [Peronosclerospora sorghi]
MRRQHTRRKIAEVRRSAIGTGPASIRAQTCNVTNDTEFLSGLVSSYGGRVVEVALADGDGRVVLMVMTASRTIHYTIHQHGTLRNIHKLHIFRQARLHLSWNKKIGRRIDNNTKSDRKRTSASNAASESSSSPKEA